ncbi:MAG: phosphate acetyltransferase [Phycisphaerae bacterium]
MGVSIAERLAQRAAAANKQIVLPEAEDDRVLRAAAKLAAEKYARITLLGDEDKVAAGLRQAGADVSSIQIVNHLTDPARSKYVEQLYEKRKGKGMSREEADKILQRSMYFAAFMVGDGRADGMVSGSLSPTADTVRAALYGVGTAPGISTVTSCSIMNTIVPEFGEMGSVIFADTGVIPEPTVAQLSEIAILAADACRNLLQTEPFVAMISFSTKGSAHSPAVQKVIDATKRAQSRRPDLKIDGEMQVDAAMIPDIGRRKCKGSPVAGRANVLVFPDLNCGNSAYKLVERFGKATALGPLLLGLAKPINDLSRGCGVDDIVLITAITAVQGT